MSDAAIEPTPDPAAAPASDPRKKAAIIFGAAMVLLIAVVAFAFAPKGTASVLPADPTGYAAPALNLPRLDNGKDFTLASLKGKPVVVNFWASWCTTCKDEAALLGSAEKLWRSKGVVFIGIDSSDKNPNAIAFAQQYGMDYLSVVDPEGIVAPSWGVTGFPETFFIDRTGHIVSKFVSSIDSESLDASINAIL